MNMRLDLCALTPFLSYNLGVFKAPGVNLKNTSPHYKQNMASLDVITPERSAELEVIERQAIAGHFGDISELSKAIGLLHIGDHFGWRVLVLIHNKRTIRKYEAMLGISVREFFPEEGDSSHRSIGLKAAKALGNFWKVVSGETKVEDKAKLEK